jgi:glutamine amidotransferase
MCRLFGFRSVIPSQVHRSLIAADNALGRQSGDHPDGWGVAYYVDGCPQVRRSTRTALSDAIFHRLSGVVSAETVLAHVRKATHGDLTVLNCHPFQHGRWLMAHNGDVPGFPRYRARLMAGVAPRLRRYVLGDTDSEVLFFLFLSELSAYGPLTRRHAIEDVIASLAAAVRTVRTVCNDGDQPPLLTVIVTDGDTMVGAQGGKELYWSTYKHHCPERDTCASFSRECEAASESGFVNHFILSSEPLQGDNVWLPLDEGEVIGVDFRMQIQRAPLERRRLSVIRS